MKRKEMEEVGIVCVCVGGGDPFALIWYGNISCSHTRRSYENKQLGDDGDMRKRGGGGWRGWRGWAGPERCSVMFFRRSGDGREWKDGGSC